MTNIRRYARADFLLIVAAAFYLVGCSENVSPPLAAQDAVKLAPGQEFAELQKKATTGDAQAQLNLGMMYRDGVGVPKDTAKAAEWYQKAAAQGEAKAQFHLGVRYGLGDGLQKDAAKAAEWYQKAAAQGEARAQYNLGSMHDRGEGVPQDAAKALVWYQKAAAQGQVNAQFNLGLMYNRGEGVPKDAAKAAQWFQKAAEQGYAKAQFYLGLRYGLGDGLPKNAAKAVEWYQKAAVQGDAQAQTLLGTMYGEGDGVPKDIAKAAEWFQKAAAQGDEIAQHSLGAMYRDGKGVPKNAAKAAEWYQKAAAQGYPEAQIYLGATHITGSDGMPVDLVLAYAWLNVAAAGGGDDAIKVRSIVEARLPKNELAEAQRLSSGWKKGQILVREGQPTTAKSNPAAPASALVKQQTGSLFVVSKTGHAMTNQHVIQGCTELRIEGREGVVKKVTEDAANDLALVQIPGAVKATAAIVADPAKLRQGEDIVVFGFPLYAMLSSGGNLTPGVVSAISGLGNNTNQIQITAPIQPGSSGSPVLNKKGEVVGVVSMKLDDEKMVKATGQIGQNVNFAVSGQTLKTFLDTHKVDYRNGGGLLSFEKSTADLADEARKWTLVLECWK